MINTKQLLALQQLLNAQQVRLIAVSKTKPIAAIKAAHAAGQRVFGENKVQELVAKQAELPKDIEWHLIGHLQSNKVKYIAPFVQCIHAVDSWRLLQEINKQAKKNNRVINCLLQIKIAQESTKFGFSPTNCAALLANKQWKQCTNVQIIGLMGMASFTSNVQQVRNEFKYLKHLFDTWKNAYFADKPNFKELSMGMSGDYPIAVEEGSTMVRIGSLIFGYR